MQDASQRNEISQEVIDTLIELMSQVIGKHAVNIVLRQFPEGEKPSGRDLVFRFAEETENLLGSVGGYAVLRQVGRDLAKRVAASRPEAQWTEALEESLGDFGFADRIAKEADNAKICNCVFYAILEERNLQPTGHAVCWTGWGFIEGFMKVIAGVKGIKWVERDNETKACKFQFLT